MIYLRISCTCWYEYRKAIVSQPIWALIYNNDLPGASEFLHSILFADDTNLIYCKRKDDLFLLINLLESIPKHLSVEKLAVIIDKIGAITFSNQGGQIQISDFSIEGNICVRSFGIFFDYHLIFFHIAEVVEKLSKHSSVKSRVRHYVEKRSLLQWYNT